MTGIFPTLGHCAFKICKFAYNTDHCMYSYRVEGSGNSLTMIPTDINVGASTVATSTMNSTLIIANGPAAFYAVDPMRGKYVLSTNLSPGGQGLSYRLNGSVSQYRNCPSGESWPCQQYEQASDAYTDPIPYSIPMLLPDTIFPSITAANDYVRAHDREIGVLTGNNFPYVRATLRLNRTRSVLRARDAGSNLTVTAWMTGVVVSATVPLAWVMDKGQQKPFYATVNGLWRGSDEIPPPEPAVCTSTAQDVNLGTIETGPFVGRGSIGTTCDSGTVISFKYSDGSTRKRFTGSWGEMNVDLPPSGYCVGVCQNPITVSGNATNSGTIHAQSPIIVDYQ
jgi:hypothetical protein